MITKLVPWWVWVLLGIGIVGAGTIGYKNLTDKYREEGRQEVQAKWDDAVERGKKEVARLKAAAGKITVKTEYLTIEKERIIREKGDTIVRQVEVFVPVDSRYFDGGFRVYHDASVENRVPDPAEIFKAAPITATEVAATLAGNYKLCHIAYAKVEGWQQWAKEQCALNENGCPDE